jgi:hypothetical protein
MTEKSLFWFTDGFDGAIGDGAAPYTEEEFRGYNSSLFGEGVIADAGNELAVTGTATPLAVNTGRAQVSGFHYFNTASVDLTVTGPEAGTTGGRVVLRADWTTATVRLAIELNTAGNAAIPAMTQTPGTLYEISLASFTVTTAGVITVTDAREIIAPDTGPVKLDELLGDGVAATLTLSDARLALFNSIRVIGYGRVSGGTAIATLELRFNNDTGNNYASSVITGNDGSVTHTLASGVSGIGLGTITAVSGTANAFDQYQIDIHAPGGIGWKTCHAVAQTHGDASAFAVASYQIDGWWRSTARLARIDISTNGTAFIAGTKFAVYGIA